MAAVLVTDGIYQPGEPGGMRLLEEAGLDLRFVKVPASAPAAEFIPHLRGCFAVIAGSQQYSAEVFAAVPELRVVARLGVGYDAVDVAAATRHGICVTTTPGTLEWAVADHTMGLIIALAHQITQTDRAVRQGIWHGFYMLDVSGKTLGLVGLGRIGQMVARRARAFDMRVLAYDPYANPPLAEAGGIALLSLDALLAESDFVSLHAPLTEETNGLIDARRLAQMKPSAYLINTARGGMVDEDALFTALSSGRLGGAGLDVRVEEPPHDTRFSTLDTVIMTPHMAGMTDGRRLACGLMAAEGILHVLRGERPAGLVNPDVWQ